MAASHFKSSLQGNVDKRSALGRIARNQPLHWVLLAWALFQLWYASPLPFVFNFFILNDTQARAIHLAFAVFLVYTGSPSIKQARLVNPGYLSWVVAILAAFCAAYIFLFQDSLASRPGAPTSTDIAVSLLGLGLLLEATRRRLGPPLVLVVIVFMAYAFLGPLMPDVIAHKGSSLNKGMSHYWLSTEGVFGIALGVSTGMVFMFVLFGALLEAAGAGNYFVRTAFSAMGHMRGGPAKAAVISSALTGMISGSSTANVVTTGTFTIPMMKRVGFSSEKAGAVEVASSTNGQLMPPVMGAAAFLMVEYTGEPYLQVIKHAFLPALVSYIALIYMVHLEACKLGLKGLPSSSSMAGLQKMLYAVTVLLMLMVVALGTYYGLGWIKWFGDGLSLPIACGLLLVVYLALAKVSASVPELPVEDDMKTLPPFRATLKSGLYFLLPIVVLMWCLIVERLSPSLSVFWATVLQVIIVLTHRPLRSMFIKVESHRPAWHSGISDLLIGLINGSRNMISIAVATAVAGIVVGTVTLTGIGFVMTEFVEFLAGGNLMLVLIFTAIICLILGMGLPTTANYIVVATLMAPVIISLGAANGLVVPLLAAHLFVFYFGILADDTPPVGIAAFAAAGISGGDPIKTGLQGFAYDIRTAILPFMFIFNTELLLYGVEGWAHLLLVFSSACTAMLVFAAATQGFMLTRNRLWETLLMLLICLLLLRPGLVWDRLYPPMVEHPPGDIYEVMESATIDQSLKLVVRGEDFSDGSMYEKVLVLVVGRGESSQQKLMDIGLELRAEQGEIFVDNVEFASLAEQAGFDFDQQIEQIILPADRPTKQLMLFPALLLLSLIGIFQRRRRMPGA